MNDTDFGKADFGKASEHAAAFQKIWTESMAKLMQAAFTVSPNSPPAEVVRQIRSGLFQTLADAWEEFMRSPQFLESTRQWMESAVAFRKLTNEFMARAHNEMQSPSRDDIDTIMLTVRHMEKRLLDRLEELSAEVHHLSQRVGQANPGRAKRRARVRSKANGALARGGDRPQSGAGQTEAL